VRRAGRPSGALAGRLSDPAPDALCQDDGMRSRRPLLILLVAAILLMGALGAAERDRGEVATVPSPAPVAGAPGEEVAATLPSSRPVEAAVGDTVVLRVRSDSPDIAKILAAGVQAPVGPGVPGELRFIPRAPGAFEVRLELAGTRAGLVAVQ
jgi:hypothetical protein